MNRRMLAALVALVLAAAGGGLVITYAKNADRRAVAGATPVSVWVAQKLVPAGTTLKDAETTGLITRTQVPAQPLPSARSATSPRATRGLPRPLRRAAGRVRARGPLRLDTTGEKAIEVPAGRPRHLRAARGPRPRGHLRHAGLAHRHLLDVQDQGARRRRPLEEDHDNDVKGTRVLMPDVLVIGMGSTALAAPKPADGETAAAAETPSFLVTVAVTPKEAVRLRPQHQQLHAVCRPARNDVTIDATTEADDLNIFTGSAS